MFEVVQVEEHHRQRRIAGLRGTNGLLAAFGQQAAVGQAGQRVVVGQPVDALLVVLAVGDLAVQAVHRLPQLLRAVAYLLLQFAVHAGQRGLGLALRAHIHRDPDRSALHVGRVYGLAADLANDGRAVLGAQRQLALEHHAARQRRVAAAPAFLPVGIAGEPLARGRAHEFAGSVAQHLFEVPIAAREVAFLDEDDAHHGMVEQHLLFAQGRMQLGLGVLLLVDVVDDPDRAFGCVVRVDQPTGEVAPEDPTVAATHLPLFAVGLPLRQRGKRCTPQGTVVVARRVEAGAAAPHGIRGAGVAEDFRIALIAAHHHALADEYDAHTCTVQQGLLLPQKALERVPGEPLGRKQLEHFGLRRHEWVGLAAPDTESWGANM